MFALAFPRWVSDPRAHFATPLIAHLVATAAPRSLAAFGDESGDYLHLLEQLAPGRVGSADVLDFLVTPSFSEFAAAQRSLSRHAIVVLTRLPTYERWDAGSPYFSLADEVGVVAWGADVCLDRLVPPELRETFVRLGEMTRDWARMHRERDDMRRRAEAAEHTATERDDELRGVRAQLIAAHDEIRRQARDRARLEGVLAGWT